MSQLAKVGRLGNFSSTAFLLCSSAGGCWPCGLATARQGGFLVVVPAFARFAPASRCAPATGGISGLPGRPLWGQRVKACSWFT